MTVKVPGLSTLTGTPEIILSILETVGFGSDIGTGDAYIKSVQESARHFFDIRLEVTGETYAERAESLLRALARNDMIELTD